MKRFIMIASVFFGTLSTVQMYAQSIDLGVKAGLNLQKISDVKDIKNDLNTGFHAGAFLGIGILDQLQVQGEVLYNRLSFKKSNLDYISVPVLFEVTPLKTLYIQAGPQFSFLANSNEKYQDLLKKSPIDLALGIEINIPTFVFYARYVMGLSDITIAGGRSNVIQIGAGFKLL